MSSAGIAEPQLGSTHRGCYSRGYLPQRDHPGLLPNITYHLADSLPTPVLKQMEAELRSLPLERQGAEWRRRVAARLDAGHGCCMLRLPEVAERVVDPRRHLAGERHHLIAWVVMPNHVHVLIRLYEGGPLANILQYWRSYTGRRIRVMMEGESRATARPLAAMIEVHTPVGDRRPRRSRSSRAELGLGGPRRGPRIIRGYACRKCWDRYIRDERQFQMTVHHIHQNPVKARLVSMATNWPWRSARESGVAEPGLGDPGAGNSGYAERQLGHLGEQTLADRQRSCPKERSL